GSSMYSTPDLPHISTSEGLIGRDAPEMAISPAQNFLKPPPVPDTPTVTLASPLAPNSSATASVMGNTVLEPSILMIEGPALASAEAASSPPPLRCLLHAESTRGRERRRAGVNVRMELASGAWTTGFVGQQCDWRVEEVCRFGDGLKGELHLDAHAIGTLRDPVVGPTTEVVGLELPWVAGEVVTDRAAKLVTVGE